MSGRCPSLETDDLIKPLETLVTPTCLAILLTVLQILEKEASFFSTKMLWCKNCAVSTIIEMLQVKILKYQIIFSFLRLFR